MSGSENELSILHLRVHSDTGGAELEGTPWEVETIPHADGDFHVSIRLTDRATTLTVLGHLAELGLDLVSVHLHAAGDGVKGGNVSPAAR